MKKDQHCVLFSSENLKINELADFYQIAPLNANLRSTCEIIEFVENYRNVCLGTKTIEIESKPAHNFHGEKVDVRTCTDAADFEQKSVITIEEYLEHSRGLAFLPVITNVPEDLLSRISSGLTEKQIKVCFCKSLYSETTNSTLNALPSVYFFDIHGLEGLEFAAVVTLFYDNGCGDGRILYYFHNMITRACLKLVLVIAVDNKLRKEEQKKQKSSDFGKKLKIELERTESKSLVFLVGTNFGFNFITPISQSKLKEQNICLPNIEETQYFKGPNDVIILQKEDLYRKKDVEEIISAGLKKLIIVGGRVMHSLQTKFYCHTDTALNCELFSGKFEVKNLIFIYNSDDSFSSQLNRFLNRTDNTSKTELQMLSGADEYCEFDELLRSNEPYFKWENWKQKACESRRLHLPSSFVSDIFTDCIQLLEKERINYQFYQTSITASATQYPKALIKIFNRLLKLYSSEISKPSYVLNDLIVAPDETYSFQWFAFKALHSAEIVIKFHPRYVKTFHQVYRVLEIVRDKLVKGVQAKLLDNLSVHEAEDGLRQRVVTGLRHLKMIDSASAPNLSQKCNFCSLQRKEYDNEKNLGKLNARKEQLAEIVCELATLFLAQIKEKEIKKDSIEARLQSFQNVLTFVIQQPIRFALEALEWNPTHKPAIHVLNESFSFFAVILNEIYNLATKVEKRNSLSINKCY